MDNDETGRATSATLPCLRIFTPRGSIAKELKDTKERRAREEAERKQCEAEEAERQKHEAEEAGLRRVEEAKMMLEDQHRKQSGAEEEEQQRKREAERITNLFKRFSIPREKLVPRTLPRGPSPSTATHL